MNFLYRPEEVIIMANVKSCERNLQIPILKQILRQLPAQIPRQIPRQKQRQKQNLKKEIPKEIPKKPSEEIIRVCLGYRLESNDPMYPSLCNKCPYNNEEAVKEQIQYFLDHIYDDLKSGLTKDNVFFNQTPRETGRLINSCSSRTWLNKLLQTESWFRKTQNKVLNQEIDIIIKSLKNL